MRYIYLVANPKSNFQDCLLLMYCHLTKGMVYYIQGVNHESISS